MALHGTGCELVQWLIWQSFVGKYPVYDLRGNAISVCNIGPIDRLMKCDERYTTTKGRGGHT